MAYRGRERDSGESDGADDAAEQEYSLPSLPLSGSITDYPKRFGAIEVDRDFSRLSLLYRNQGELGWQGCLMFVTAMGIVTILGLLSMLQNDEQARLQRMADTNLTFAPTQNHFAFLWLFAIVGMLIGIPMYVIHAYKSPLVFVFDRRENALLKGKHPLVSLNRIENVTIRETKDPDDRYLYLLQIVHTDGHEILLYNGYEERQVMNLANEISSFLDCRTRFATGG